MKKLASAVALAAAALCATAPVHAGVVISFTPSSSTINVGETATVTMSISGLGTEILSSWDFNVVWNSAVVSLDSYSTASGLAQLASATTPGFCFADINVAGQLGSQCSAVGSDDDVAAAQTDDGFVIGTFTFKGLSPGGLTTGVELGGDPDYSRNFVGRNFESLLGITYQFAKICVVGEVSTGPGGGQCAGTPPGVPEPTSYALAGVALFAAGWAGRGRRRTVKAA